MEDVSSRSGPEHDDLWRGGFTRGSRGSAWSSRAEKGTARGGALRGWWRRGNGRRALRCIPRRLVVEHGGGSHRKS
ncbi:hypothetical protein A2U01_0026469 [Trifolium medium]|uniref:Uncharacterized protein n=1 Tax=Trifolium medium TaxID=97028 RepID=A0A392P237_9FABA|nr:hypothetical protein [Trifolium medium]